MIPLNYMMARAASTSEQGIKGRGGNGLSLPSEGGGGGEGFLSQLYSYIVFFITLTNYINIKKRIP